LLLHLLQKLLLLKNLLLKLLLLLKGHALAGGVLGLAKRGEVVELLGLLGLLGLRLRECTAPDVVKRVGWLELEHAGGGGRGLRR